MKRFIIFLTVFLLAINLNLPASLAATDQTPSGINLSQLEESIDTFVEEHIGITTPGAAITVVNDGEIIFSKGYGYADIESKIPVDPQYTIFEYGSISKLFVWTAAMQLVEQGKLDLNADIRTYLPDNTNNKLRFEKKVTMNDLMSHTAGFEDYHFDLLMPSPDKVGTLEEAIVKYQPNQVYEPRAVIAYSNYSTALAGYIIEKITSQSFSDYEMEHIFQPLLMNQTSGHPTLADHQQLEKSKAKGYFPNNEGDFTKGEWSYIPLYPAGSVNGSAEDLAKYAIALMPNDTQDSPIFNSRNTLDEMLTQSYTPNENMLSNAHGFWEYDGKVRGLGHGGNTSTMSSNMVIVPEENFGVIILTNASGEMAITYGLVDLLIGKSETQLEASKIDLPSSKEVEGMYISARQSLSTYTELLSYIMSLNIMATEENEIKLNFFGMEGTYTQIQPYLYQLTSSNDPYIENDYRTIYFEMGEDGIKRLTNGTIADFLPLQGDRQLPWLMSSLVITVLSFVFFIMAPIILLLIWIIKRKKMKQQNSRTKLERRLYWSSLLVGTLILLNNLLLIIRSALSNSMLYYDSLKIHLIFNWILFVVALIFVILNIMNWKKVELKKLQKIMRITSYALITLFIIVLFNWNYFNFI